MVATSVGIREIKIHPRQADLILATHGRGIYILDDITPLRQVSQEILSANVSLFKSRPTTITTYTFLSPLTIDPKTPGAAMCRQVITIAIPPTHCSPPSTETNSPNSVPKNNKFGFT